MTPRHRRRLGRPVLFAICLVGATVAPARVAAPQPDPAVPEPSSPSPEFADDVRYLSEPIPLDADELETAIRLRKEVGLVSDAGFVASLYERPAENSAVVAEGDSRLLGLVVTDAEAGALFERNELERATDKLAVWARQRAASYAGLYVGNEDPRGVTHVRFTEQLTAEEGEDLLAQVPEPLRDRVRIEQAAFSEGTLQATAQTIREALEAAGVAYGGTATSVPANAVVVWLADPTDAKAGQVIEGSRGMVPVEIREGDGVEDQRDKDDALLFGVVIGGQRVGPAYFGDFCTSAFAVHGAYGSFIMTAGHCLSGRFGLGYVWQQSRRNIGPAAARNNGGSFDGGLISNTERPQAGRIHLSTSRYFEPVNFLSPGDAPGFVVCNTGGYVNGVTGPPACGTLIYTNYQPYGYFNPVFRAATYRSVDGDSGSGIYRDTAYGRSAEGVHKGEEGTGPNRIALYSYLPIIMYSWALTLDSP